ncbi:cupin domain-containing protein [Ktedonospora formicarum]|uniref:Cupin n=1 Tax=Ktedonospora formicarum TaxID=2778364 RepID=A0A8J3IB94_9CHLR|nr:cupin domain-containing protein [Ktedonospora formicarum]GHO49477.1 cupin [Ktedonospora formicarum]
MFVTRAVDAPTFQVPGFHFTSHTAPSRGATETVTWRLDIEPGAMSMKHSIDREEIFIATEGTFTIGMEDQEVELHSGDAIAVPARTLFQLSNRGEQPARAIVCLPAGATGFEEDGSAIGAAPWTR